MKYFNVYAWTVIDGQPELIQANLFFDEQTAISKAREYIKRFGFHVWVKTGDNVIFEY